MMIANDVPYHIKQNVSNAQGYYWDGYFFTESDKSVLENNTLNVYLEQGDWNRHEMYLGKQMFNSTGIKKLHYIHSPLKSTDMMFHNCYYLEDVDCLGETDLSNVLDASSMFFSCNNLKSVPDLNLGECQQFYNMFSGCSNLESIGVIDMGGILYEDDIPSGTAIGMFSGCRNLKNVGGLLHADISIGLSDCISLTREAVLNIFNSVSYIHNNDERGVWLSIDYAVYNQLSDDDIAILTSKNWILSVVNNEGPEPGSGGEI